jgi:parallel beta-helix repeat protein
VGIHAQSLQAKTRVVGPNTCRPSLPHFSTIQEAVNASEPGATILVCPGTYPEQVVISTPLTLQGIIDGTSGRAVLTVPPGGLVANGQSTYYFLPVAVQLLIQNTTKATVSNLTVDGTGGSSALLAAGVEFYNVGIPSSSTTVGNINNVVVRNCSCIGILSDTSYTTILSNEFHDVGTGIVHTGGMSKITSNTITKASTGVSFLSVDQFTDDNSIFSSNKIFANDEGIHLQSTRRITASANTIVANVGMILFESSINSLTGNTIIARSPTNTVGISLIGTGTGTVGNQVTGNTITGPTTGLSLLGASSNVFHNNVVSDSQDGVDIDDIQGGSGAGGNVITNNKVDDAACGILVRFSNFSVYTPNTLFNVSTTICN